jgi:UV DNA damage endonuclease
MNRPHPADTPHERYRLGVAVKLLGAPLRSHDSRRWQNQPHLSVSLAYVRDIFEYLHSQDIHFYRLSSHLAPYATHPDLSHFHRQIEECQTELAAVGDMARLYDIRLSLHPAQYVRLNSPEPYRVKRAQAELEHASNLLDALGADDNAVIVIHVGGGYGDPLAARERFVVAHDGLPTHVRRRLALENDDRIFSIQDAVWIHRRTGIRLVLDVLHHRCLDPACVPLADALAVALATWPPHQKPKIHFSSPRTELRRLFRNGEWRVQMPLPNQHSDFVHPFEFIDLLHSAREERLRPFDIMLEAKAKDLALLRLRQLVDRYAPELTELLV